MPEKPEDPAFDEVDPNTIENPKNPKNSENPSLQEMVQAYHHAVESEFNVAPEDDPEIGEKVRRALLTGSIEAAKTVVNLARFADKDATRLSASKIIIDVALNRTLGQDDPLKQLFNELTAPKTKNDKNFKNFEPADD